MASDDQIDRLVQAIELQTQVLAGAIGGVEEAVRSLQKPPPSSRPSSGKQKTVKP